VSLILDALTRAEREKRGESQGVPDLLTPSAAPERRRRRLWLLAVPLLALVALVVASPWWWPGDPAPAPTSGNGAAPPAASAVDAPPAVPAPTAIAAAPATRAVPASSAAIAALYAQQEGPVTGEARTSASAAGSAPGAAGEALAGEPAADAPGKSAPAAPTAREETPLDLEQVLREVREAAADSGLAPHPVALLSEQSKQFRDRIPTLMYLRHDYRDDGPSSVVLNGDVLRTGQRTGAVEVIDILPDSVILRFDGREFRLRALNSWVNL
jgi:general secretion pathway protein B